MSENQVEFTMEPSEDKFTQSIDQIVEQCSELVLNWTNQKAGNMLSWYSVMQSIMGVIENKWGKSLKGIEKAEVATAAVVKIARNVWDKTIVDMTEEEQQELRTGELKILCLLMDNPEILSASTSILKKVLNYIDVDGDGDVDDDDRTFIGSPHADFTYGLNLNASFKGFDISAFFSGSQGNDAFNVLKIYTDFPSFVDLNRSTRVLDSWTPENTGAELPALSAGAASTGNNETNSNSYYVEDASYFRLKNLQIGYTLPSNFSSKLAMDNARIYVQGTNLFTITDYNGADPEIQESGTLGLGVDYGKFPQSRILSVGFKFNF